MAVPPRLPKLSPEDMAWARWVTSETAKQSDQLNKLDTRIKSANLQRSSTTAAVAASNQGTSGRAPIGPQLPVGDPQKPTAPTLSSDHATVTIRWDGLVDISGATAPPQQGFDYVSLQRSSDNIVYTTIGTKVGVAGTIVDTDVTVGNTYWYRLITTDTLNRTGPVSDAASIVVVGVDLGSLDDDLAKTLYDLQHSATSGGLITYATTAPTDPAYHAPSALWFDTSDPNGAVPKRWNATTSTWDAVPYGSGALGEGSIVSSKILAGAIDTAALGANAVTANNISAGAITTEKLSADSVVTNKIAAGAIDADRLAVGAVSAKALSVTAAPAQGTPINRVPKPLTDVDYWSVVISGAINLIPGSKRSMTGVTAGKNGITAAATNVYMTLTSRNKVPTSRQIHVSWSATATIVAYLRMYDANDVQIAGEAVANGEIHAINAAAASYALTLETSNVASTISQFSVFEVIGDQIGSKQAAQLSPSGLRLFNDEGQLSVDITTNSTNFISILNNDEAVLTLNESGNGNFNAVTVNDDFYVAGEPLIGDFMDYSRSDGTLDGAVLDRLPRGVQYAATWNTMDSFTVSAQYQRIATGSFQVDADRTVQLVTDLGGLQTDNNSGVNVYVELQVSTSPFTDVAAGAAIGRSVVFNGETGTFAIPPITFISPTGAGYSSANRTLPPNTPIYWQINTNLSAVPSASYKFNSYASARGFSVVDTGPAIAIYDGTDRSTTGGTATGGAGSGSGGNSTGSGSSTTTSKTQTWTASWSGSWNQGGSNKVTGTGTYTDADRLYQGYGASNMGAKFGFPGSVQTTLSGKTITKVEVWLQNRWTWANAGGTASFRYHGSTSAGSSYGNDSGSTFTRHFDRGQGRWLTISNSEVPYSSWKSGGAHGLALIVEGGSTNYAYYDGVGKSNPPKLRITYK
jgi:hypothetical protein